MNLKRLIQSNYFLYYSMQKMTKYKKLLVNHKTDIVIEGFPRCANTFAVVAFNNSNPNCNVAHHMHVIAQLKGALKYNKPCIVLIRNPVDAIKSYLVRHSKNSVKSVTENYLNFYEFVLKHKEYFIISDFDTSTTDFGKIIELVNNKFETNFHTINLSKQNIINIFTQIDSISENGTEKTGAKGLARPSKLKNQLKEDITIPRNDLNKCHKLYSSLILDSIQ